MKWLHSYSCTGCYMVNWCQHVIFLDSINSYFDNNNTWFSCILVSMLLIFLMFGFRTGKILISHKHLKKVKNLELFLVDLLLMELFLIRYRPFFVFLDYLVLQVLLFFFWSMHEHEPHVMWLSLFFGYWIGNSSCCWFWETKLCW